MEIDIEFIFLTAVQILNSFLDSGFFWFIKFFLAIYVSVLFVDIILLLVVRGLGGDIKKAFKGTDMPLASKKKMKKRWEAIEERLKLNDKVQCKIAILEADGLADEVLKGIGLEGANMKERLEKANSKQIEEIDNLIEAHEIRNKIIQDDNFYIDTAEAGRIVGLYREFLDGIEII